MTTTALLATFLSGVDAPFEAAAARESVRAQLAALPADVFVDPELRREPDAVVTEALTVLVRLGTLAADGPRYRLTETRTDARFPHIADMVDVPAQHARGNAGSGAAPQRNGRLDGR